MSYSKMEQLYSVKTNHNYYTFQSKTSSLYMLIPIVY